MHARGTRVGPGDEGGRGFAGCWWRRHVGHIVFAVVPERVARRGRPRGVRCARSRHRRSIAWVCLDRKWCAEIQLQLLRGLLGWGDARICIDINEDCDVWLPVALLVLWWRGCGRLVLGFGRCVCLFRRHYLITRDSSHAGSNRLHCVAGGASGKWGVTSKVEKEFVDELGHVDGVFQFYSAIVSVG